MQFTEAKQGRTFILRLEHGDVVTDTVQEFAKKMKIKSAYIQIVGGADKDSSIVVGPKNGEAVKPEKIMFNTPGVAELAGVGTIFTNESGEPKLHLHAALGRDGKTFTGCCWPGVKTWHIAEVIIQELLTDNAIRKINDCNGFELLEIVKQN